MNQTLERIELKKGILPMKDRFINGFFAGLLGAIPINTAVSNLLGAIIWGGTTAYALNKLDSRSEALL